MSFDLGSQDLLKALGCMVLSGPFLTGYTQVRRTLHTAGNMFACRNCTYTGTPGLKSRDGGSGGARRSLALLQCAYLHKFDRRPALLFSCAQTINDWYDREIDAINEPYRPIPSGAISEVSAVLCRFSPRTRAFRKLVRIRVVSLFGGTFRRLRCLTRRAWCVAAATRPCCCS